MPVMRVFLRRLAGRDVLRRPSRSRAARYAAFAVSARSPGIPCPASGATWASDRGDVWPGVGGYAGSAGGPERPDAPGERGNTGGPGGPAGPESRIGGSRHGSAPARNSARSSLTHRGRPANTATTTPRITPPNSQGATDARVRTIPSIADVSVR